jgi:hypothetical protein
MVSVYISITFSGTQVISPLDRRPAVQANHFFMDRFGASEFHIRSDCRKNQQRLQQLNWAPLLSHCVFTLVLWPVSSVVYIYWTMDFEQCPAIAPFFGFIGVALSCILASTWRRSASEFAVNIAFCSVRDHASLKLSCDLSP